MTGDLPIVACSWLLRTALRGAAAGVGSLVRWGVVLIVGFSGSIIGLVLGVLLLGALAGFHITDFPFVRGLILQPGSFYCSTQPAFTGCSKRIFPGLRE